MALEKLKDQMDNSLWQQVVDKTPVSTSFLEAKEEIDQRNRLRRRAIQTASALLIGAVMVTASQHVEHVADLVKSATL